MVICKEPIILAPFNGFSVAYFSRTDIKPGISFSAISISFLPHSAWEISAILYCNSCFTAISDINLIFILGCKDSYILKYTLMRYEYHINNVTLELFICL